MNIHMLSKPIRKSSILEYFRKPPVSAFLTLFSIFLLLPCFAAGKPRARDLRIPFEGAPGKLNAITDVKGVCVGHSTLIAGEGALIEGKGPVRTGVTAILPAGKRYCPVFAGWYSLNGNGELTGTAWIEESGFLETPILLTNTHSVGLARDALIAWMIKNRLSPCSGGQFCYLPVVGETSDSDLNDINGFHVKGADVYEALDMAKSGPVPEGNAGAGTGMTCYEFKGGIGTASRVLDATLGGYTVGALVQANHGARKDLLIAGVPVGHEITDLMPLLHSEKSHRDNGSIIVVIATDAPLLPHQLKRLARRASLGMARTGGVGHDGSGDIFLAFSTANLESSMRSGASAITMLSNDNIDPLFEATIQATEESIINALVSAETMTGVNGNTFYALPHDRLKEILKRYNRLKN